MAALAAKLPPAVLPWASVSGSLRTNKGGASEERHARAVQRDITSILLLRYSLHKWKLGFGMRKGGCQVFEHEKTKSGVLPILGSHTTMDPLEDKLHTLHATRHVFG